MFGLDFSGARPGGAALAANGIGSVGRYLGTDWRCIGPDELNDYLSNGVGVWFIKENRADGMLHGYGQGVQDALDAQAQLNVLGQPSAVVYFTADFDAQPYQFAALDSYLAGVATVIPIPRIGLYAGIDYLNHAASIASWYWKTASSSFDHGKTANMQLHLIQTLDAVPISGTDYDVIVQANHGQVGTIGTTTSTGPSDAVKAIQTALNAHGYTLDVDGLDGPLTDAAIRDYQAKNGLTVDGIVGPHTWASLNGTTAPATAPAAAPTNPTAPAYPLPDGSYFGPATGPVSSVSGYYSHNADLQQWQQRMKERGWVITVDGLYGPQTESVTRSFQTQKGLTVDGLIGPQTWAAAWTAPIT